MRALGHVLLWIGFLAAAFWSVSRLEQVDNKWSTVPWGWYTASILVGVAGIALLRSTSRRIDADEARTDAEYGVIQKSLGEVTSVVARLSGQSQHVPSEVLRCIDDECEGPFADFAEARQALIKRFGMKVYAEVMTEFASAERYVNRTWSAAADGYVNEIAASLDRADRHLHKAQALLLAAESQPK